MHNNTEDSWGMVFQPHWKKREGLLAPLTLTNWSIGLFKVWQKISWIIFSLRFDWSGILFNSGVSTDIVRSHRLHVQVRNKMPEGFQPAAHPSLCEGNLSTPLSLQIFLPAIRGMHVCHQRSNNAGGTSSHCIACFHVSLWFEALLPTFSLIWSLGGCQPTLLAWITFLWISTAYHAVRDAPICQFFSYFNSVQENLFISRLS